MKTMPPIGARVRYRRKAGGYLTERICTGTVVAQYHGGDKHTDPETGAEYTVPDAVAVKVDAPLPAWWPYPGTNRFAPDVAEVSLLTP